MGSLAMIRSRLDFAALQTDARSRIDPLIVLRYRRNGLDHTRFGISTGRRTGTAVVRNTIRRRVRTILVGLVDRISAGWDVLVIARPPAARATQAELGLALDRLFKQARLTTGATEA